MRIYFSEAVSNSAPPDANSNLQRWQQEWCLITHVIVNVILTTQLQPLNLPVHIRYSHPWTTALSSSNPNQLLESRDSQHGYLFAWYRQSIHLAHGQPRETATWHNITWCIAVSLSILQLLYLLLSQNRQHLHCWNVFTRKTVSCIWNKHTSFANGTIANNDSFDWSSRLSHDSTTIATDNITHNIATLPHYSLALNKPATLKL